MTISVNSNFTLPAIDLLVADAVVVGIDPARLVEQVLGLV